jgi:hypothetical protein
MYNPGRVILQQSIKLARASASDLEAQLLKGKLRINNIGENLFRPPVASNYDVTIFLRKDTDILQDLVLGVDEAKAARELSKKFKNAPQPNLTKDVIDKRWPAGFHPFHRFISELKTALASWCIVCHNDYDWNMIGILWRPARFMPSNFKLSNCSCTAPAAIDMLLNNRKQQNLRRSFTIPDIFQMLHVIRKLGDGLIERVQIADHNNRGHAGAVQY